MEKRGRSDRLPLRLKVRYTTVEQFLIDYSENIRRGGSFVRTNAPLPPGTRLHLEIEVAGVPVFIKLRGRVLWVNDPAAGEWHRRDLPPGMGVLFIFPDDSSRLLLENLVERLERMPHTREKTISPEFLEEIIRKLRPDIQEIVRTKSEKSKLLKAHISNILGPGKKQTPNKVE